MNENLNLAEILKDCPKGTKLWSPLCGECELYMISHGENYPIFVVSHETDMMIKFTEGGRYYKNGGVCVLFPSREQWDWSKFQRPFKEGDVIYVRTGSSQWVSIFKEDTENKIVTYADYNLDSRRFCGTNDFAGILCQKRAIRETRLATEEEKQKLFQAIKDNGYKWNAETKTLEKLDEPKFKVGDKIQQKNQHEVCSVSEVCDNHYLLDEKDIALPFFAQDDWELAPDKFDITTLKPFDRVLVRDAQTDKWCIGFFEKIDTEEPKYDTAYSSYRHCIPYNDETKHLLGKAEMEPEYYRVDEY